MVLNVLTEGSGTWFGGFDGFEGFGGFDGFN